MIEEIIGPRQGRPGRLSRGGEATGSEPADAAESPATRAGPGVVVSSELRSLVERVKNAEDFRKERVHQVLEKMRHGELVVEETIREAAQRILHEGL